MQIDAFFDPEFNKTAKQRIGDAGTWVRFHGRLLPEVAYLSLGVPVHSLFDGLSGIKIACEISMSNSQIYVLCLTAESHLPTIRNYVTDQVQVLIDAYGFLNGFWADVDIRTAAPTAKPFTSFSTVYDALAATTNDRPLTLEVLTTLLREPAVALALGDIRNAMRSAIDSGLFCYRALEACMQSFRTVPKEDEKKAWLRMNQSLNIEYEFTKTRIKMYADARRHGVSDFFITGDQRDQCLLACATVIYRFCKFVESGKLPLSKEQFPILTA